MHKIQNDIFCLCVSNDGAELEELWVKGINILWQGKELWAEKSPFLFPIVGNLKNGYFTYNNQDYFMNAHGFLKHQCFEVVEHSKSSITLKNTYTEDTLRCYPFLYEMRITYTVYGHHIKISLEIYNLSDKEMYYSLGWHPGFDYSGLNQLLGDSISLGFSPVEAKEILFDPKFVKKTADVVLPNSIELQDFSKELVHKKTVCYQGVKQLDIKSGSNVLRMQHQMPFTAFWQSAPENPKFLCVEPWDGLPDVCDTNHRIDEKKFIKRLEGGMSFKTDIDIEYIEGVKE